MLKTGNHQAALFDGPGHFSVISLYLPSDHLRKKTPTSINMASPICSDVCDCQKGMLGKLLHRDTAGLSRSNGQPCNVPLAPLHFYEICLRRLPRAQHPHTLFVPVLQQRFLLINHTISIDDLWMRSIGEPRIHTRLNVTLAASLANSCLRPTPLSWHQPWRPWRPHPPHSCWSACSQSLGNQYFTQTKTQGCDD
jgi:hypothetical protein